MSRAGVVLRLLALGLVFLLVVPPHLAALRIGGPAAGWAPLVFHRAFLRLFGVRVIERGTPPRAGIATLVLANHVSWLDIPVIGSLHPLSFIAKAEIEGWPVIGLFARLQRSVFIDRQRRKATAEVNHVVAHRLRRGEVIVLFAEGTTGDGNRVLPFRSSLVGAAQAALAAPEEGSRPPAPEKAPGSPAARRGLRVRLHRKRHGEPPSRIHLQPLAIAYTRRNGLPVTRRERPAIAWYGDMDLPPHLSLFVREGPLDAVVTWGEPVPFDGNRKLATARAEAEVRRIITALG